MSQFDSFMDQMVNSNEDARQGQLEQQDVLEKDFDRAPDSGVQEKENVVNTNVKPDDLYPDLSNLQTKKVPHQNMILDGVCERCAHCSLKLTDSVSIQRGIGPICSKKGYSEDPVKGDEVQAMVDLAEFPELVQFLVEHYKPLGLRGLVNGLVRVASLNRPRKGEGNEKLFGACCDAIDSLGHERLARLLRETLATISIKDSKTFPGSVELWIKKAEWKYRFGRDARNDLTGYRVDRSVRAAVIPVVDPSDESKPVPSKVQGKTNKATLWSLLVQHYEGHIAKTKKGAVKVKAV